MKYRKRPVEVEAIQWTWDNAQAVRDFLRETTYGWDAFRRAWIIHTWEGDVAADPGDWIVKGVVGEFYPVKPDVFALTYEPVEP